MASSVEKTLLGRTLTLSINDGVTVSGNAKVRNRSFNSINPEASDTAMFNAAKALGGLMSKTVTKVTFNDKNLLQEVENS